MSMPIDVFEMYWESMGIIDAQRTLKDMSIADYPQSKKEDRKRMHRGMHKAAYPDTWGMGAPSVSMDAYFGKPLVKDDNGK